uniref:RNase H type-1 domain-containing protein n=1 Tax=Hyaloperonospora arabidopsidis (strain Emoy2) TaxID=559515 RepID=M4B5W7_HYAAE
MGSVSLAAAAKSNNVAECKGILFGLRNAQDYNLNGLHAVAMDSKKNTQISQENAERLLPRWTSVKEALRGDLSHWLEMNGTAHADQIRKPCSLFT